MGLFLPTKRPTHRRFSYQPKYYNPKREENIRRRIRIKARARRRSPVGIVYLGLLLFFVVYIYLKLG